MLAATDSFIEYLYAELGADVPVYWWRQTAVDEHGGLLKLNALNVQILGFFEQGSIEYCLVSLDLLGTDERRVLGQLQIVRDLLFYTQVIPELDYSYPAIPYHTGRAVGWTASTTKFQSIRVPSGARYVHYNATFPLITTRE